MVIEDMRIELLYFDDCPSWQKALDLLQDALGEMNIKGEVRLIPVETQEQALENKFTGSPMIRVNGLELFPTGQESYGLGCRVYQTPEGYQGWPTKEMMLHQFAHVLKGKRIDGEGTGTTRAG